MNKEENKNQAEELQRLFQNIQDQSGHGKEEEKDEKMPTVPKVDVLNLPPRKEVHRPHQTGFKIKFRRPLLRFVFVLLLLILITVAVLYIQRHIFVSLQIL